MGKMKSIIIPVLFLIASPVFAQQKPCEELKSEIAAKLDAKGVKNYKLDVLASADVKDQKIVGSCEAGTKKIAYSKDTSAAPKAEKPAATPKK